MYGGFFVKKYTKLFLGTLCFLSAASVFAGNYKGDLKGEALVPVTIPNFDGGFAISAGALYMEPTTSNLDYMGVYTVVDDGPSVSKWQHYRVDPNFDWGFTLGLGYVFANTANDVRVDWMSFHNDYKDSQDLLGVKDNNSIVTFWPTWAPDLPDTFDLSAQGKMEYGFDAVDLTFGQYINLGSKFQARFAAGLRWAQLDSDMSTSYNTVSPYPSDNAGDGSLLLTHLDGKIKSHFDGIGPVFSFKGDYALGGGLGLVGGFNVALLVGNLTLKSNMGLLFQDYIVPEEPGDAVLTDSYKVNDALNWDDYSTLVTPAFDGKFGLHYGYDWGNGIHVGAELGYQVSKYIDVVQQIDRGDSGVVGFEGNGPTPSDDPDYFSTDVTNFGLNGMYITISLSM